MTSLFASTIRIAGDTRGTRLQTLGACDIALGGEQRRQLRQGLGVLRLQVVLYRMAVLGCVCNRDHSEEQARHALRR